MPVKVVQIKGSNGSGKTTIVKQMLALSEQVEYLTWGMGHNKPRIYATMMHDLGWAAVGNYRLDQPMGGCDLLKSNNEIKCALLDIIDDYPRYNVVFEGMMISTIKSTFYNFLLDLERTDGIEPVFVILRASIDTCLEHLRIRGTMKENVSVDNVASKCQMVIRHAAEYDQKYVRHINVNLMPVENMLMTFLEEIGAITAV